MMNNKSMVEDEINYSERKRSWRGILVQSIFLFILWLVLSGRYDAFHLTLGVISVCIVHMLNARINRIQFYRRDIPEWERANYRRVFRYIPWLIWQIVVASLQVAYVVLHPRMPIKPALLFFKTKLPNAGARVILGNSITLTPGTVTLLIEEDDFVVHSLTEESSAGLIDGTMPRKVAKLFRQSVGKVISDVRVVRTHDELNY